MKTDYEYFWDFIYNGYPFTEVCERKGADLEQIKQFGYRYLTDPMSLRGQFHRREHRIEPAYRHAVFGNCIVLAHTDGIKTIYKHIANSRRP